MKAAAVDRCEGLNGDSHFTPNHSFSPLRIPSTTQSGRSSLGWWEMIYSLWIVILTPYPDFNLLLARVSRRVDYSRSWVWPPQHLLRLLPSAIHWYICFVSVWCLACKNKFKTKAALLTGTFSFRTNETYGWFFLFPSCDTNTCSHHHWTQRHRPLHDSVAYCVYMAKNRVSKLWRQAEHPQNFCRLNKMEFNSTFAFERTTYSGRG